MRDVLTMGCDWQKWMSQMHFSIKAEMKRIVQKSQNKPDTTTRFVSFEKKNTENSTKLQTMWIDVNQ